MKRRCLNHSPEMKALLVNDYHTLNDTGIQTLTAAAATTTTTATTTFTTSLHS